MFESFRSRRRHSLEDHDPQPVRLVRTPDASLAIERPACLQLACESAETIAHRLWSETDGAFRDKSAEDRHKIAEQLRFLGWRKTTNRLNEGTP